MMSCGIISQIEQHLMEVLADTVLAWRTLVKMSELSLS